MHAPGSILRSRFFYLIRAVQASRTGRAAGGVLDVAASVERFLATVRGDGA
jgi:hypothetical protein